MEKVLIQNGFVLPMATAEPKITVSDVLIEGSKISRIDKDIVIIISRQRGKK